MARRLLKAEQTQFPDSPISKPMPKLSTDQWGSLGETVMQLLDINRGNREGIDESLDRNNAMYEMRLAAREAPYRNPSNLCVPIVAAEVDELTSRIVGTVIQPRTITVRGNNPQAAQQAHLVEQFLNNEAQRNGWWDAAETCIHLTARDGTAFGMVTWDLSTHEQVYYVEQPQVGEDGQALVDDNGEPITKRIPTKAKYVDFDAPKWTPVEFRDLMIVPNFARTIDEADLVGVKIYMNEHVIDKLVEAGIFDAEQAERCLQYVNTGQGELSRDPQGYSTYEINKKINVVDTSVSAPEGIKMSRGPLEIWLCITNLFDLDGDGHCEENIIWVHNTSRLMLGFAPYEYHRGRNIFPLAIWPRPNRIPGFAVGDRLGSLQDEANALRNGRLDYWDQTVNPLPYRTNGAEVKEDEQKTGFNTYVQVQNPNDFGYIVPPPLQSNGVEEEQLIKADIAKVMGSPQAGSLAAPSANGRMSRRQQQQMAAMQAMQSSLVMSRVRKWMLRQVEFSVGLYLQYGKNQMDVVQSDAGNVQVTPMPRELLAQDFTFGITGLGGVMDKDSRREDMLMLYQLGMQNPLIAQDPSKVYMLTRQVFETFDIPEVTGLLGTLDDAKQQAAQQAQAAQNREIVEMLKQILSHNTVKPGKASAPPQGGSNAPPGVA